ncbi:DUF3194 domain-containing protein [Natrarchaeobius halalkaliphilus]|uniref:DUF3194 domain-containing protein n=1 Tax=Natrarchaeobius halalkaliphilus TaxID=1679091 RepID=A0A3N6LNA9_9EURY|nr:DUF3194 domain-containing protein [Natrarchaeobius halalkaliphilus]RQG87075.1 DUF3194 domain-containing protein [Natrarchaeobius halalkaliphilus]
MTQAEPTDEAVVQTASDAAEGLIFSRYKQSVVRDCDVTVTFEEGVLDVDVYVNVPDDEGSHDPERVADDAALAAQEAVDELFEESG